MKNSGKTAVISHRGGARMISRTRNVRVDPGAPARERKTAGFLGGTELKGDSTQEFFVIVPRVSDNRVAEVQKRAGALVGFPTVSRSHDGTGVLLGDVSVRYFGSLAETKGKAQALANALHSTVQIAIDGHVIDVPPHKAKRCGKCGKSLVYTRLGSYHVNACPEYVAGDMDHSYEEVSKISEVSQPSEIQEIWDNGGETADRYTVFLTDGSAIGLSDDANMPNGFNMWVDALPGDHLGTQVQWTDLPDVVQQAVVNRLDSGVEADLNKQAAGNEYTGDLSGLEQVCHIQSVRDNWVTGTIDDGYGFDAKIFAEPSNFGIDGGRISKLLIFDGDRTSWIYNYDRGYDDSTEAGDKVAQHIVEAIDGKSGANVRAKRAGVWSTPTPEQVDAFAYEVDRLRDEEITEQDLKDGWFEIIGDDGVWNYIESGDYYSAVDRARYLANLKPGEPDAYYSMTKGAPASWVQDEDIWDKAKDAVDKKDYPDDDSYWAVVTTVYKDMGGKVKESSKKSEYPPDDEGYGEVDIEELLEQKLTEAGVQVFAVGEDDPYSTSISVAPEEADKVEELFNQWQLPYTREDWDRVPETIVDEHIVFDIDLTSPEIENSPLIPSRGNKAGDHSGAPFSLEDIGPAIQSAIEMTAKDMPGLGNDVDSYTVAKDWLASDGVTPESVYQDLEEVYGNGGVTLNSLQDVEQYIATEYTSQIVGAISSWAGMDPDQLYALSSSKQASIDIAWDTPDGEYISLYADENSPYLISLDVWYFTGEDTGSEVDQELYDLLTGQFGFSSEDHKGYLRKEYEPNQLGDAVQDAIAISDSPQYKHDALEVDWNKYEEAEKMGSKRKSKKSSVPRKIAFETGPGTPISVGDTLYIDPSMNPGLFSVDDFNPAEDTGGFREPNWQQFIEVPGEVKELVDGSTDYWVRLDFGPSEFWVPDYELITEAELQANLDNGEYDAPYAPMTHEDKKQAAVWHSPDDEMIFIATYGVTPDYPKVYTEVVVYPGIGDLSGSIESIMQGYNPVMGPEEENIDGSFSIRAQFDFEPEGAEATKIGEELAAAIGNLERTASRHVGQAKRASKSNRRSVQHPRVARTGELAYTVDAAAGSGTLTVEAPGQYKVVVGVNNTGDTATSLISALKDGGEFFDHTNPTSVKYEVSVLPDGGVAIACKSKKLSDSWSRDEVVLAIHHAEDLLEEVYAAQVNAPSPEIAAFGSKDDEIDWSE